MNDNPLENLTNLLNVCADDVGALHQKCVSNAPNYGVQLNYFQTAISNAVEKYLVDAASNSYPGRDQLCQFLSELQLEDLYLALGCTLGNEFAWWDFDSGYRPYIERISRHLASAANDAEEVIDHVYVELYGTRVVDGVRQSKFATYTGRGTLKGWLRTIVWHAVIDLHRARRDEVPLDDWSEGGGESDDRPGFRAEHASSEKEIFDRLALERYANISGIAFDKAFGTLANHERLLLLYYHIDELKLREIARLVEKPESPLRIWFQRQSKKRSASPESKVHESTVMRWLERTYTKLLSGFKEELSKKGGLTAPEIETCMEIARSDFGAEAVRKQLATFSEKDLSKEQGGVAVKSVEG